MKHFLLIISFFAVILPVKAQNVPYESLDAYSKVISSYQMEANNLSFTYHGTKWEFSFPESSFNLAFHNQLGTEALYKNMDGRDLLYLTENIDLSKVKGITWENLSEELILIKLHLKSGDSVKTNIYENGKVINTHATAFVNFFCKDNQSRSGFVSKLYDACLAFQKAKGLITAEEIAAQKKDWGTGPAAFIKKHPNSIYNMEAEQIVQTREKEKEVKTQVAMVRTAVLIDSISDLLGIRIGMSQASFTQKKPEVAALFFTRENALISDGGNTKIYYDMSRKKKNKILSPVKYIEFKNDKLTEFAYSYSYASAAERLRAYELCLQLFKNNVPPAYINIYERNFVVTHPTEKYGFYVEHNPDWDNYEQTFMVKIRFWKRT